MPVFAYKAIDLDASAVRGTVVADTPRAARDQLRARGLSVESVRDERAPESGSNHSLRTLMQRLSIRRPRRYTASVASLVRELSTLLAVGIPLLDALDTIARQQSGSFRGIVLQLRDRVASGSSLADAMRGVDGVLDDLCVSMTEVGEQAGNLDSVLDQLAQFQQRMLTFRGRVATALLYPCIVLFVGLGVGVFLMSFVVPKLLEALVDAGKPLPWATHVVKSASDLLVAHGWLIALAGFGLIAALAAVLRSRRGRTIWHRWQLKLPVAGELFRKQAVSRMAMVISTLMRSGIAFERALAIAQRTTANLHLRQALEQSETAVVNGRDIGEAMEAGGAFGPTVVQIFAIGQQSGRLEEMLERLAVDYDQQVAMASQRLASALEPVLIVLLAAIVGFIAFATVLPILEAGKVM